MEDVTGCVMPQKIAKFYGYDFSKSVNRLLGAKSKQLPLFDNLRYGGSASVFNAVKRHSAEWFRIGTMGDPCHNWGLTFDVCSWLGKIKTPVIITKHWCVIPDELLVKFAGIGVVFNTSISPLDTIEERATRIAQFNRLKSAGIKSVLRIVSCKFGETETGHKLNYIQRQLFDNYPIIDNPLRIPMGDSRVINGDIITERMKDINGFSFISLANKATYIGKCNNCPDQCGVKPKPSRVKMNDLLLRQPKQLSLLSREIEYIQLDSVIGSGFEVQVADLAIRDKVAYRAARKNMQIHSAIILKINGEFSGFFTYQVNHAAKEFCLLQSAMELDRKDKVIYAGMVNKIIDQNKYGYPMIMCGIICLLS